MNTLENLRDTTTATTDSDTNPDAEVLASNMSEGVKTHKPRGFAAMSKEKVREIAALGGKRAHELGVGHRYTREEARHYGSQGGKAPHKSRGRVRKPVSETV